MTTHSAWFPGRADQKTAGWWGDNRCVKKSAYKLGFVVLLTASAATATWGDEPTLPLPTVNLEELAQGKTDPKDKTDKGKEKDKDKGKEKDKDKKLPEIALERPLIYPEGRLDFTYRTLPRAPEMLGDPPPLRVRVPGPTPEIPPLVGGGGGGGGSPVVGRDGGGGGSSRSVFLPGPRGFKVADNGSPRPQDRVYFGFQYYDDIYGAANRSVGANVGNISMYREYIGLEKTFLGGAASLDFRLPLNTLQVDGATNLNGSNSALGDLSMVLRYAVYRDELNDNYFTAGLAVTAPTGPSTVGGVGVPAFTHSTILQPFVGVLWNSGDWYVQGFSAIDVPTDSRDVTLWYNDICFGYFVYRTPDPSRLVTAFAPAFEVHVANPLNYRSNADANNPVFFPDSVNLGAAGNFEFRNRARLSAGVVTPVTGPQPFNVEGVLQLRVRY